MADHRRSDRVRAGRAPGRLIDAGGAPAGYLFAFAAGLAAVSVVIVRRRCLTPAPDPGPGRPELAARTQPQSPGENHVAASTVAQTLMAPALASTMGRRLARTRARRVRNQNTGGSVR